MDNGTTNSGWKTYKQLVKNIDASDWFYQKLITFATPTGVYV
ncbi:MAG: hypothetical protein ABIR50_10215 [Ginsengibacter sp.]